MEKIVLFIALAVNALYPLPDSIPPTKEEVLHNTEFYCAALTVFAEARGESPRGQALVAATIRNRAFHEGGYLCDITNAPGQYVGLEQWHYPRHPWASEPAAWNQAQAITMIVLLGWYKDDCSDRVVTFHVKQSNEKPGLCDDGAHTFR